MAGKRLFQDLESDQENKSEKRLKSLPLFASVFGALNTENTLTSFSLALEPLLRKVVSEEVELGVNKKIRSFSRSSSFRVEAPENIAPTLKLVLAKNIQTQPIFTGTKITDVDNAPLQVILVDGSNNDHQIFPVNLDRPIRLDIVALHGDFPSDDKWSSDEFERNIVKERDGKRPLIAGEVTVTMRNGVGTIGDIEFTDNSRWVRSRKFRIGVKVAKGSSLGVAVCEAMTEAFIVKDHRGELYKKHHPPMLEDEVWRLEKIGKDGPFHKKLTSENINNVQDFLKLSVVDLDRLRQIMSQMSDKIWDVTLKHARECTLGNKLYIHSGPKFFLTLNPICEVMEAVINGQVFSSREALNQLCIKKLVQDANSKWDLLEVMERKTNGIPLLTQGDNTMYQQYGANHYYNNMEVNGSYQQNGYAPAEISTNTLEIPVNPISTIPMEFDVCFNITGSSSQSHLN